MSITEGKRSNLLPSLLGLKDNLSVPKSVDMEECKTVVDLSAAGFNGLNYQSYQAGVCKAGYNLIGKSAVTNVASGPANNILRIVLLSPQPAYTQWVTNGFNVRLLGLGVDVIVPNAYILAHDFKTWIEVCIESSTDPVIYPTPYNTQTTIYKSGLLDAAAVIFASTDGRVNLSHDFHGVFIPNGCRLVVYQTSLATNVDTTPYVLTSFLGVAVEADRQLPM